MKLVASKSYIKFNYLLVCNELRLFHRFVSSITVAMSGVEPSSNVLENSNVLTSKEMTIDKNAYTVVREGKAEVLFPSAKDVFYNPVQEFNRDLSVLALQVFSSLDSIADDFPDVANLTTNTADNNISQRPPPPSISASAKADEAKADASLTQTPTDGRSCIKPPVEKRGLRVLEALAASGLRSCRFALEVTDESTDSSPAAAATPTLSPHAGTPVLCPRGLHSVLACDLSAAAVAAIERNVCHNGVEHIVKAQRGDASMLMYSLQCDRYDVIDLDPYGSPVPFLDAAVKSVAEGGILQVTCTDMGVLCGAAPEKCQALYSSMSARSKFCHEMALRIALQCVSSHANRCGRYIEPLLSVSVDFYIRMYIRVRTSQALVKLGAGKSSYLLLCVGCRSWRLQPRCQIVWSDGRPKFKVPTTLPSADKCPHCRSSVQLSGPIWTDPLHDSKFVQCLLHRLPHTQLGTAKRLQGVLTVISEELPDVPLHYDVTELASACRLKCAPTKTLRSALLNAGYRVSGVHTSAGGLKTDAPASFVWEMMRAWEKLHPANKTNVEQDEIASALLLSQQESDTCIDFTEHLDAKSHSQRHNLLRFQKNPAPNWGPKARAKISIFSDNLESKRLRNQGKKSKRESDLNDDETASELFPVDSESGQSENGAGKRQRVE